MFYVHIFSLVFNEFAMTKWLRKWSTNKINKARCLLFTWLVALCFPEIIYQVLLWNFFSVMNSRRRRNTGLLDLILENFLFPKPHLASVNAAWSSHVIEFHKTPIVVLQPNIQINQGICRLQEATFIFVLLFLPDVLVKFKTWHSHK